MWKEAGRQGNWLFLSDIQGLLPHKTTTLPNAEHNTLKPMTLPLRLFLSLYVVYPH